MLVSGASAALRAAAFVSAARRTSYFPRCSHGHVLSPANVYVTPGGRAQCRACRRGSVRRWERAHPEDAREQKAARQRERRAALRQSTEVEQVARI
jgi:hypothetical protein